MSEESCKEHFDRQGFVYQPAFLSQEEVERINSNLRRLISDVVPRLAPEHVFYEDKNDARSLKQIQRLQDCDPFFAKLMNEGPFRALAQQMLDSEVIGQNIQYFNKPPGTGLPTPPHQDGFYFKLDPCEAITMWLALEPVDEENGCVRYVPKSHLSGMRPHGTTGTLGFSQGITDFPNQVDTSTEIGFPAQPGDLLAHHALTIHRASGNSSPTRSRQAMGLIYYSVKAKQDVEAWRRYQASLKESLTKAGRI